MLSSVSIYIFNYLYFRENIISYVEQSFLRFSNLIYTRKITEHRNPQKTTAAKSSNSAYKRI